MRHRYSFREEAVGESGCRLLNAPLVLLTRDTPAAARVAALVKFTKALLVVRRIWAAMRGPGPPSLSLSHTLCMSPMAASPPEAVASSKAEKARRAWELFPTPLLSPAVTMASLPSPAPPTISPLQALMSPPPTPLVRGEEGAGGVGEGGEAEGRGRGREEEGGRPPPPPPPLPPLPPAAMLDKAGEGWLWSNWKENVGACPPPPTPSTPIVLPALVKNKGRVGNDWGGCREVAKVVGGAAGEEGVEETGGAAKTLLTAPARAADNEAGRA